MGKVRYAYVDVKQEAGQYEDRNGEVDGLLEHRPATRWLDRSLCVTGKGIAFIFIGLLIANLLAGGLTAIVTLESSCPATFSTKFGLNSSYMSISHDYDHFWDREFPAWNGIIHVPSSDPESNANVTGAIAMFHALHCLTALRSAIQAANDGAKLTGPEHADIHWPHCMDYLRNHIICAADDTFERDYFPNATLGSGFISGQHDVRQCHDSQKLYALREKYGSLY